MSDRPDLLANDVSLTANLESKGVSAAARSRLIAAIDRLCGNVVDTLSPGLEAFNARRREQSNIRQGLIRASGEAAIKRISDEPKIPEQIVDRFLRDELRRQDNKDAIVREAIEELASAASHNEANPEVCLEEDWLNVFASYAEQATSDRLRNLWSQILAGEIRKPRSFSLSTLRLISELDAEIARAFERALVLRFDQSAIVQPKDLEGDQLLEFTFLQEVGLLQHVTGFLGTDRTANPDGTFIVPSFQFALRGKMKPNNKYRVPQIMISRIGREISTILPASDGRAAMIELSRHIEGSCDTLELGLIVQRGPGTLVYTKPVQVLKEEKPG